MSGSSGELLAGALRSLDAAIVVARADERYAAAHLAALRAAAAVLAHDARSDMRSGHRRPTSVWTLLARVAPDLAEWAAFFAAGTNKRIAAQAGMISAVSEREADDLVRETSQFISLVAGRLGAPHHLVITA